MNIAAFLFGGSELMFDLLEFYRFANQLVQSPSEAAYRTAISRAYYAVFLTISNLPAVQRVMPPASYREGSHIDVIRAIRRLHKDSIAEYLSNLKQLRTLADYDLAPEEKFQDWEENWKEARRLTEWLIAALPSLHNTR